MRDVVGSLGGIPFLIIALVAGVVLLRSRKAERWGRRWLTVLAVIYFLIGTLALPALFGSFLWRGYRPLAPGPALDGVSTVVVLSGGYVSVVGEDGRKEGALTRESLSRVMEGVRVFRMVRDGRIVASGSPEEQADGTVGVPEALVMQSTMTAMGVPADRIILEGAGRNTRDQAVNVAAMLRPRGIDRVILVTSPFHMTRAVGCFRAVGLNPIPAVSSSGLATAEPADYVIPNEGTLQLTQWVFHEYVGLAYYRARGWVK